MPSVGPARPPATIFESSRARESSGSWRVILPGPRFPCSRESWELGARSTQLPAPSSLSIPVQAPSTGGWDVRIVLLSPWQWQVYIGSIRKAALEPLAGWKDRLRIAPILPNQPPHVTQSVSGGVEPERTLGEQLINRLIDIAGGGQRTQRCKVTQVIQSLSHSRVRSGLKRALGNDELGLEVIRQGHRGFESGVLVGKPALGVVVRRNTGVTGDPDIGGRNVGQAIAPLLVFHAKLPVVERLENPIVQSGRGRGVLGLVQEVGRNSRDRGCRLGEESLIQQGAP